MFGWFKSEEQKIRDERERNDRDEILDKIKERQKEAEKFGGTWTLSGAIFPTKAKEKEYYRYISQKQWADIKNKAPDFYEAIKKLDGTNCIELDTERKTWELKDD